MTETGPRVDALLPAWRAERFIGQTLDALAAQSYGNLHILISDDASPDGTAALCEAFAARTPRTRLIRQPRNLGWLGNSNALLQASNAEYFFFALHDDLPHPHFVERMVDALQARPGAVAAFCDLEHISLRHGPGIRRFTELEGEAEAFGRARKLVLRKGQWWLAFRALFRADAAQRLGGLRRHPGGDFCSDFIWLLGLAMYGEFVRVPDLLITKRQQGDGVSARWRYSFKERSGLLWATLQELQRAPLGRSQRTWLQLLAMASGARGAVLGRRRTGRRS